MAEDSVAAGETQAKKSVHPAIKIWLIVHVFVLISRTAPLPTQRQDAVYYQKPIPVATGGPEEKTEIPKGTPVEQFSSALLVWNRDILRYPSLSNPLTWYVESSGVWQYWDMFAPNPASVDIWFDAQVTFKDGTIATFKYPRMKTLPIPEKYFRERYRKYLERLTVDNYAWKWPHTGYWVAKESWKDPSNPPVKIELVRHWKNILPPPAKTPEDYSQFTFYTLIVDENRLREFGQ